MGQSKKSKAERKRDREIMDLYHQKVTEDALEPLYEFFQQWKNGNYPYHELTERIHEFHKENQQIWSMFNYHGYKNEHFLFQAKKELNLLTEEEKEKYRPWLDLD